MYQDVPDSKLVNLARAGDALAWLECLARGLESRALVNVNGKG
jgi:hypothetical protein